MLHLILLACGVDPRDSQKTPTDSGSGTTDSASETGDTGGTTETDSPTDTTTGPVDLDGDGWTSDEDCDDNNAAAHPGGDEVCGNEADDDCDGRADERCTPLDGAIEMSLADATFVTTIPSGRLGAYLGAVGDQSGDGLPDIGVAAGSQDIDGVEGAGAVYVLTAAEDGEFDVVPAALAEIHGEAWQDQIGDDGLMGVGDVTGDGNDDIALVTSDGVATWVVPGPASGIGPVSDLALDVIDDGLWYGSQPLGSGDLNGDGQRDLVLGGPIWSSTRGAIAIVPGPISSDIILDGKTISIQGDEPYYCVGRHGSTPGDIDGDGMDDLVVGSKWCGDSGGGSKYTWFVQGPITESAVTWDVGVVLTAHVSTASGPAGDTDGDGYLEFWATVYDSDWPEEAGAYIVGDPGSSEVEIADISKARLYSSLEEDYYYSAAAGPGDVDGDGFDDLLLGNPTSSLVEENAGSAWLGYGPFNGLVDMASVGATFGGAQAGTSLGNCVAGPGDTDGDGFADLLIGAADNNEPQAGTAWLFRGR